MSGRGQVLLLILVMAGVAVGVAGVTLAALYEAGFDQQRERLLVTAQSWARLVEAIYEHEERFADRLDGSADHGGPWEATLAQVQAAQRAYAGFGDSGEFMLGQREGELIVFLLSHVGDDVSVPTPVPYASDLAEPMRRALEGKSGTVIGQDYHGVTVLAAHEPIPRLGIGVVAKIDLAEVRAPFVRAGLLAAAGTLVLTLAGTAGLIGIGGRMVRQQQASERRHRQLFESNPCPMWVYDLDTLRFLEVNDAACAHYGYSRDEFLARTIKDIRPPEDVPALLANVAAVTEGLDRAGIWRHRKKDGTLIDVEIASHTMTWAGRRAEVVLVNDVTERVRAERQLRALTARYEAILAAMPDVIVEVDANRRYAWANRAAYEFFGSDVLGHEAADYFVGEQDTYERVQRLFDGDENVVYVESWRRRHDGEPRLLAWWCRCLKDAAGRVTGALSTARDITEQRQAQEALRQSEERARLQLAELDQVYKLAPVGLFVVDRDYRYVRISDLLAEINGVPAEAHLGRTVGDVLPGLFPTVRELWRPILERGEPVVNVEVYGTTPKAPDVRRCWLASYYPFRAPDGTGVGLIGAVLDITERKRAEEELARHREHLEDLVRERTAALEAAQAELLREERLATLGRLIATISHELRNPLGTVRTTVFALAQRLRRQGLEEEHAFERIERNIRRCDRIIEELLDYTRIVRIERQPTRVDDWLADVVDELAVPDRIEVRRSLAVGIEMPLDRERLRRCVVNIWQNAVHAMSEPDSPGRILTVESAVLDRRLEIRVRDTGVGIPPQDMDKIFEPLFSTRSFGVGLGLSIVQQIMKQHGGGIDIHSAPGRGTTATLWLPLSSPFEVPHG